MISLGTVSSTCFPKIQPSGAGEIDGDNRTLYQSSVVSCSSGFSSSLCAPLFVPELALPAFGAMSLSVVSAPFSLGTRFHPIISKLEPLSSRIMMFSLLPRSGVSRRFEPACNCPVACACNPLSSSASFREFSRTLSGIMLRASIQPSVFCSSCARTRYQRSFFVLSLGSGTSTCSRMSTMSPRFLSSRFAETTAVELRICALRATTTPVLLLLASVLHPATNSAGSSTNEPASKDPFRFFNSICYSRALLLSRRSRGIIVTQLSQQIALRLAQLFADAKTCSQAKRFDLES